jgi:putative redox protein
LKKKGLAGEGTRVLVTADKLFGPARLDNFKIDVQSPIALNEEQRRGVEDAVHHCLIHNTLMNPPKIELEIECPVAAS